MPIECYEAGCPFHSCHHQPDDGPFCDEPECQFSDSKEVMQDDGYTIQKRRTPGLPGDSNIWDVQPSPGTE